MRFRNAVICASLGLENGFSPLRQVVRTAILVRDVPYGTLQLVFFEFFKELPPFFRNDPIPFLETGGWSWRLVTSGCVFLGWISVCRSTFFHMTSARFVCEAQNSGDILVHQDFYTSYNKVVTLKCVDFIWFLPLEPMAQSGEEFTPAYLEPLGSLERDL